MAIEWNKVTRTSQLVAIILFLVVFALAFWLGMTFEAKRAQAPEVLSGESEGVLAEVTYACDEDKSLYATYREGSVTLALSDGRGLTLSQVMSGSGVRYANADESFVFWNKGTSAFVTEGTDKGEVTSYANCNEAPLPQ